MRIIIEFYLSAAEVKLENFSQKKKCESIDRSCQDSFVQISDRIANRHINKGLETYGDGYCY
ncbi:hypothetical protein [Calothrix sp. NIES-2100]|uniref:hypothetical protein n=1 Tax=Calothrix sp. NIES-2100 TaxID=1954172 RepID=UPI0030D9C8EA